MKMSLIAPRFLRNHNGIDTRNFRTH